MTKFSKIALCALIIGSSTFFTSCDNDDDKAPAAKTLYQELGGTKMVTDPDDSSKMIEQGRLSLRLVTNSTIQLIVADITAQNPGNFAEHFAPLLAESGTPQYATSAARLSKNITDIFSVASGGDKTNTYSGLDMVTTHDPAKNPRMGKKVNDADMTRFIGFVGQAADMNGVKDPKIIAEVVALLETLRAPIVQS